jgi:hypothetical protein
MCLHIWACIMLKNVYIRSTQNYKYVNYDKKDTNTPTYIWSSILSISDEREKLTKTSSIKYKSNKEIILSSCVMILLWVIPNRKLVHLKLFIRKISSPFLTYYIQTQREDSFFKQIWLDHIKNSIAAHGRWLSHNS